MPALAVEQTATVSASWTVPVGTTTTPAAVTVRVDPAGTVAETTEANNAVDHLVPVRLRPAGAGITAMGWDETADAAHDGNLGVLGFSATLSGTVAGGGGYTKTVSAPAAANQAWFGEVPPGSYTLTGSMPGYGGPSAVPVTITRDAGDPYLVSVAWGAGGTGGGPQLWFNRWGSITGTVTSGGPLGGVRVTEREQGLTVVTAADGSYSLPKVAAGVHHLTFTRDGYGRVQDVPATVPVGSPIVVNQGLAPTTVAYVDVTVTNDAGTGLPAATVELLPGGGGPAVASCTTGADGTCSLQPPGGTSYRVRAVKAGYVTATGPAFPAVAGRASPQALALAMDVGTLSGVSTGPRPFLSWVQYESIPFGGSVWVFWGSYVVDLSATHQNVGGTEHLRSLDLSLDGNPIYVELMKNTVSVDIGGPYAVQQIPVLSSNTASDATNVRVDAIRVYDRLSGTTYFAPPGGPLLYSHTATGDSNAVGYTLDAGVDWSNVVVTIDVRVGKAVAGTGGAAGWVSSPVLTGWRSDVQRITWVPSENAVTVAARLG